MHLPRHRPVRALAFLLLSLCSSVLAAQDVAQIRSRVELVVVPVTVKGRGGALTTDLTKEAFSIKEAGKPQTITNFSIDPVPISAVILVDTGISEAALNRVKASFPALAGAFAEGDEVEIYRFEKVVERVMDFSSDRPRVIATLAKLERATPSSSSMASGPFSTPGPVINGVPIIPGVQAAGKTNAAPTKVLHDALFQAAEDLGARDVDRRRIVILISDGENHNSLHSYDTALERLLTHDVQVFSIGVDTTLFQRVHSSLGSYANDTGGDSWFPDSQGAIEAEYTMITDAARNQYVLSYVSSNKRPAGRPVFREIKVQVSAKNTAIRHRRGYYQAP